MSQCVYVLYDRSKPYRFACFLHGFGVTRENTIFAICRTAAHASDTGAQKVSFFNGFGRCLGRRPRLHEMHKFDICRKAAHACDTGAQKVSFFNGFGRCFGRRPR